MGISQYIKEIGRGKEGARSLSRESAHDLMSQILDGRVTDLEIGAFALSMRIKGESIDELIGFLQAVHERCTPLVADASPVVLASYNGARKLPNLTPLLAQLLAQEGLPVLVHGPVHDPGRVTTAAVFHDLGLPTATSPESLADDVAAAWMRREPVFVPTGVLCPPLARLLDVRWVVGLRNSGHTVAKLLDPFGTASERRTAAVSTAPSLRVMNYTHPEYGALLQRFASIVHADAMVLRGTEGEPVADPRRTPKMDVYLDGDLHPELSCPAQEGVLAELPLLPRECDAATTAHYIQAVASGEKPAPRPIVQQVNHLLGALAAMKSARAGIQEAHA